MYRSKYQKKKHLSKRSVMLLTSLALLIGLAVGSTLAYIFTSSPEVTNTFTPARVTSDIEEEFDPDGAKKNVYVTNTGNVDAYIRAKVIITWTDLDGNPVPDPVGYSYTPKPFVFDNKWQYDTESDIYYYSEIVGPGKSTENLIDSIAPVAVENAQYRLKVDILADAIQADGLGDNVTTAQQAFAKAAATN